MTIIKINISIHTIRDKRVDCRAMDGNEILDFSFYPEAGNISFNEPSSISEKLEKNIVQLRKVLVSAVKGKIKVGQTINCVFIEEFRFIEDKDFDGYIRLDRRQGKLRISCNDKEGEGMFRIYTDGSYIEKSKHAAIASFIESPTGEKEIFTRTFDSGSSNLMELLAVTEGLERLQSEDQIQVNTDSRYVIRGLVQWVHFWRHNDWRTAYDREVKYSKEWKKADKLCDGKLIDFHWIKGHSGNEKQDFCHRLAYFGCDRNNSD